MNNLFVLHTQYNIILGTSVILNGFQDCQNDLIVYAEFSVSDNYKKCLSKIFNRVLYIREGFEPPTYSFVGCEKALYLKYKKYRKSLFYKEHYDNLFLSQDRPLENLIVGHSKKKNRNCKVWDIEEDCYYSILPEQNEPNYRLGWHTKRSWFIRKLIYGSTYCTDERSGVYIYGQSSYFDGIYALFPELIRPQLSRLEKRLISKESIVQACKYLYPDTEISIPNSSKYYLFFFDLLERYRKPDVIKNIVEKIVVKAKEENAVVLLKYHPRETQKFEFVQTGISEIPFTIPAEKLLCDLDGKNVTVYGNATTAVIVSAKMGFETVTVARIESPDNIYMIEQFKKMRIQVLTSTIV